MNEAAFAHTAGSAHRDGRRPAPLDPLGGADTLRHDLLDVRSASSPAQTRTRSPAAANPTAETAR